jgi:hypothetical protein
VVLPYCCAIQCLLRNLVSYGAERDWGETSLTTVAQSRFSRFLNFSSSRMGRLRHNIYILAGHSISQFSAKNVYMYHTCVPIRKIAEIAIFNCTVRKSLIKRDIMCCL